MLTSTKARSFHREELFLTSSPILTATFCNTQRYITLVLLSAYNVVYMHHKRWCTIIKSTNNTVVCVYRTTLVFSPLIY